MPTIEEQQALYEAAQEGGAPSGGAPPPEAPKTATQTQAAKNIIDERDYTEIDSHTRAGRKEIRRRRKKLRKELKQNGIKSRREFENIARDLGLVLDDGKLAALLNWGSLKWGSLISSLGLKTLLMAAGAALSTLFLAAALTEEAGSFTINLTADMLDAGFVLSETEDFARTTSRLFSLEIEEVNNITLDDIDPLVYKGEGGEMTGSNYIGYSFYIRNEGDEAGAYKYTLEMPKETMDVGDAVWVMLFEDNRQVIYARESADGDPEEIFGYRIPPFYEESYYPSSQYYEEDGRWGLITTPFDSDTVVESGFISNMEPGEYKKYTVVIWIEGYDPECTNDIFGGYAKLSMDFSRIDVEERDSIFDGVYRTEYDDYVTNHYE